MVSLRVITIAKPDSIAFGRSSIHHTMPSETITQPTVDTVITTGTQYVVISEEELDLPYRVIIQNDDVTPMNFVVSVLMTIFELDIRRALSVMLEAHDRGRALVTTLPLKEAQERVYAAQSLARDNGYPLSFYLEPDA